MSSMTIRIPSLSDSSRTSEMPVSFSARTSSAIFAMMDALFVWYGISLTTMLVLPLCCVSMLARARIVILPLPVRYASWMPARP